MKNYLKELWAKFKANVVKIHKSVTIWFNGLVAAFSVGLPYAEDSFHKLQGYIPANLYHYLLGLLIVGNIALRFKTSVPLSAK